MQSDGDKYILSSETLTDIPDENSLLFIVNIAEGIQHHDAVHWETL